MIIGTAGHIDHGKTTLVRALTGVDTDRLPEEKKRGISIELGYAFMDDGRGGRIGFVDVPGHERLVHTMLAGATGMDHALLLVAADDGVMPQTREHLAVLSLLGLDGLTLVITKCDRADAARLQALRAEIAELLAGSGFEQAAQFEVAAPAGLGVEALRAHLLALAPAARPEGRGFRLAVDRAFSLDGVGTVATGSIHAGQVSLGDELLLLPPAAGQAPKRARVRSLHAQNQQVQQAQAGQRCALGLVGLDKQDVARGQVLAAPELALSSERLDVRLRLWPAESKALRSGTPVHVHLGSATVMGTVAILHSEAASSSDSLAPGAWGWVQLVLREPVAAWAGDRVVLRDAAASRTLAGGRVLDPAAPARYRRTPQRLAELAALQLPLVKDRLQALLAQATLGLNWGAWATAQGLSEAARQDLALQLPATVLRAKSAADEAGGPWLLGEAAAASLAQHALAVLAAYHAQSPDELGPDVARWRRLAAPRLPEPLWRALVQGLLAEGKLQQRGAMAHLPAHGLQLNAADERVAQRIAPWLDKAGFEGAWARDLARDCQTPEPLMRTSLARLAQSGLLHQVVKDLYYAAPVMTRLAALARQSVGAEGQELKAAAFRDASGLGRKRAIQILEYFDRVGLSRRVGDSHKLRPDSLLFSGENDGDEEGRPA
ncbi:selenocysteine-specific elongation factor [Paucibacter oligotrophus]|uniref:Selenocysteine-specific elongation factor n=1 Tax=Roseateles oligotrophus TaxID=1769250 RepID=A0A840L2H0_9BURK|nr:selenocysteine-specific translation elongation factor [Roseateles oligotrophus]MBB4842031.1 selenocysteine-specific elongation factor [Roseateles oligotrophus]